jgi:sulfatase maturation enzyme AslB (radical SAM superfamily)
MIKQQFEKHKISQMQLDPFGVCNAKCWFCPVKYKGNPKEGKEVMSIELLEKIIVNLLSSVNFSSLHRDHLQTHSCHIFD